MTDKSDDSLPVGLAIDYTNQAEVPVSKCGLLGPRAEAVFFLVLVDI